MSKELPDAEQGDGGEQCVHFGTDGGVGSGGKALYLRLGIEIKMTEMCYVTHDFNHQNNDESLEGLGRHGGDQETAAFLHKPF